MRVRKMLAAFVVGVAAASLLATPGAAFAADNPLTAEKVSAALNNVGGHLAPTATKSKADVRNDGTIHFRTRDAGDIVITLPDANKTPVVAGGNQIYLQSNGATVVRPTEYGAQSLLVAANKFAPTSYQFGVNNGYVAAMPDGGLLLLDRNVRPTLTIQAPWGLDAKHRAVPTDYDVSPNHTSFTQNVLHNVTGVVYPVVADPWVSYQQILSWPGNVKIGDRLIVYFDRFETANMAGVGAGVASALLSRVGVPTWVSPIAVGVAREAVYQGGKCATLQFDLYWGWLPSVNTWVRNC